MYVHVGQPFSAMQKRLHSISASATATLRRALLSGVTTHASANAPISATKSEHIVPRSSLTKATTSSVNQAGGAFATRPTSARSALSISRSPVISSAGTLIPASPICGLQPTSAASNTRTTAPFTHRHFPFLFTFYLPLLTTLQKRNGHTITDQYSCQESHGLVPKSFCGASYEARSQS